MLDVVARVPIAEVIERSGVHLEGRGRYLRAVEHDSLIVDTRANLFNWNQRGIHGDAITWLTKICKLSFTEAREQLEKDAGTYAARLPRRELRPPPQLPPLQASLARGFHARMTEANRAWWRAKGVPDHLQAQAVLGACVHRLYGPAYTIPVFEAGALANLRLRLTDPAAVQKFGKYRPWDRGRGAQLYGRWCLTPITRGVVVVAGEIKALVLQGMGIDAVSPTGGCSTWKPEWTAELLRVPNRWVAYDPNEDGAGERVAREIGAKLAHFPEKPDDFILAHGVKAFVRVLREAT